jgi:hypothetical protein
MTGDGQQPEVLLNTHEIDLQTTYIGVPVVRKLTMRNPTQFPVPFSWQDVKSQGNRGCYLTNILDLTLVFSPPSGVLEGKATLEVSFEFTGHKKTNGSLQLLILCNSSELLRPTGFELHTTIEGLKVSYGISTDGAEPKWRKSTEVTELLNFGEIPLFSKRSLYLLGLLYKLDNVKLCFLEE